MAAIAPPMLIDLTSAPALDTKEFLTSRVTPRTSTTKKDWKLRMEAAEEARKYYLAGRKIRAAVMAQRKAPKVEAPSAALLAKIIAKLQEAEIRRDMEQEAIKFSPPIGRSKSRKSKTARLHHTKLKFFSLIQIVLINSSQDLPLSSQYLPLSSP